MGSEAKGCPVCGQVTALGLRLAGPEAGESVELRDWCREQGLDPAALCAYCRVGRVPSPCIGFCQLDQGGASCLGCRRTSDEITSWVLLEPVARALAWRRLRTRTGGGD